MAPDESGAILENHIQERRYIEVVGRSVVIGLNPLRRFSLSGLSSIIIERKMTKLE